MCDEVWHTIGVDLIGPLPETARGNKYIMTVSCYFSKWPEATALPNKNAVGVAEFLFKCLHDLDAAKSRSVIKAENLLIRYRFIGYLASCEYTTSLVPHSVFAGRKRLPDNLFSACVRYSALKSR